MREAVRWLILSFAIVSGAARASTIAVVPFGEAAKEIESPVRVAIGKVDGVRLSNSTSTATDVEAAKGVGLACGPDSDECLVKLALFLHVDQLVSLAATRTAEGFAVDMILVDAALGRRAGEVKLTLGAQNRAAQLDDAALLLLAPDLHFGVLELSVTPPDAHVDVDGVAASAGTVRLRAGTHSVTVSREGYFEKTATVEVKPATTSSLAVALEPVPTKPPAPPPEQASMFLPGVIAAGAGSAVLIGGAATALVIDAELRTEGAISGAQARGDALTLERLAAGVGLIGGFAIFVGAAMIVTGS